MQKAQIACADGIRIVGFDERRIRGVAQQLRNIVVDDMFLHRHPEFRHVLRRFFGLSREGGPEQGNSN